MASLHGSPPETYSIPILSVGAQIVHSTPSGWYSSSTSPSNSAARFLWINRVPNPVLLGGKTGGPFLSHYAGRGRNRIRAKGPEVSLGAKPALALGLALHELGTNAAKYGALSNDEGYIEIAWTVAPHPQGPKFRLRWCARMLSMIVLKSTLAQFDWNNMSCA
jgi:hypothetical protein